MKIKLIIGVCLLFGLSAIALFFNNRHAKPEQKSVALKSLEVTKPVNQMQQAKLQDTDKATEPVDVTVSDHPIDEQRATQQMYLAHAPLRMPEVADPDSETNRVILQTMVQKALLHNKDVSADNSSK